MSIKICSFMVWLFFCLFTYIHGAALPEPAAAKISYALALRQKIQDATWLDKNTATLCTEYVGPFRPFTKVKKCKVDAKTKINCLALVGQRYILADNNENNNLEIFDADTQQQKSIQSPHRQPITALLYKPPFTMITGSNDLTLRAWDIRDGKTTHTFSELLGTEWLVSINRNLFASFAAKFVYFWDADNNSDNHNHYSFDSRVYCFSPFDENGVAIGFDNGAINLVYSKTLKPRQIIQASQRPIIELAMLSKSELVALDQASSITIWDVKQIIQTQKFDTQGTAFLVTLSDEVIGISQCAHQESLENMHRIKQSLQGILREKENLTLNFQAWAVASEQNSFALVARENTAQANKPKSIYIVCRENEGTEEKCDDEFEQWIAQSMEDAQ